MITIEEIEGRKYTVVWSDVFAPQNCFIDKRVHDFLETSNGVLIIGVYCDSGADYTATALPALPRHPKPSDAPLLYRYMAEGIYPAHKFNDGHGAAVWCDATKSDGKLSITHAIYNGERVNIAITEGVI